MHFNLTASIVATLIVVIVLVLFYRRREQDEGYLALKLIGYYLLGSFVFNIQHVPVPLGFLVYLLAFRPRTNASVKRYAAVFGLIMMIAGKLLPF